MTEQSQPSPEQVTRIAIAPRVVALLEQLEAAGYETWCVGGAIRDGLLGNPQNDVDLATAAPPIEVRRIFRRTVPVGMEHGTVGVLDDDGVLHEVTTFRRDVQTDGRHAVVEFGVSLEDDLARRDFTINAIAYHPVRHDWRDPFNGRADLAARLVRAVGTPSERFREDRLRIVRAIRFAARFEFAIDPATWTALADQAGATGHLSAERVCDEWTKSIATSRSLAGLVQLWQRSGVAKVWMPELDASLVPFGAEPDVAPRDPVVITAAWCRASAPAWRRLKGSARHIRRAEAIDRGPATPAAADQQTVRRWMMLVGGAAEDLEQVAQIRRTGPNGWLEAAHDIRARREPTGRSDLAVTGLDLEREGIPAGPEMGALLGQLLLAVVDDPALNQRDALIALARSLRG